MKGPCFPKCHVFVTKSQRSGIACETMDLLIARFGRDRSHSDSIPAEMFPGLPGTAKVKTRLQKLQSPPAATNVTLPR